MRPVYAIIIALLLLPTVSVAAAPGRTVTETIVPLPPLGQGAGMCATGANPVNVGFACFEVRAGETHASVTVADAAVGAYGGFYAFALSNGTTTAFETYCGGAFEAHVPAGARLLRLSPGQALTTDCPGSGTVSEVTVTFT